MPENKGDPMCPVASYATYLVKLNPKSDWLWQKPKSRFSKDASPWYESTRVGHNLLDGFMTNISKYVLDSTYTNHSLRSTAITIWKRNNFTDKQLMSCTGHKSRQSLDIYEKVTKEEKLQMGSTLTRSLNSANQDEPPQKKQKTTPTATVSSPPEGQVPVLNLQNQDLVQIGTPATATDMDEVNFDLLGWLTEFENQNNQQLAEVDTNTNQVAIPVQNQVQNPVQHPLQAVQPNVQVASFQNQMVKKDSQKDHSFNNWQFNAPVTINIVKK